MALLYANRSVKSRLKAGKLNFSTFSWWWISIFLSDSLLDLLQHGFNPNENKIWQLILSWNIYAKTEEIWGAILVLLCRRNCYFYLYLSKIFPAKGKGEESKLNFHYFLFAPFHFLFSYSFPSESIKSLKNQQQQNTSKDLRIEIDKTTKLASS